MPKTQQQETKVNTSDELSEVVWPKTGRSAVLKFRPGRVS